MPLTELILTENVPGLGAEADVVKVRRGYARNYLLPRGKAYEVTSGALRQLDALKQKRAEREARELNEAEELARRIGKARFVFTLETGETGKAFGSVTAQDIVNRIKNELGAEIDRHKIEKRNTDFYEDKRKSKKKRNKWRLNRPRGPLRSLAENPGTDPAEAGRREAAKKLSPFRQQVLRRIFTVPRPTAWKRSKACWAQCSSRRAKQSPNASRKLMKNTFTFPRTARFTVFSSIFGTQGRRST